MTMEYNFLKTTKISAPAKKTHMSSAFWSVWQLAPEGGAALWKDLAPGVLFVLCSHLTEC